MRFYKTTQVTYILEIGLEERNFLRAVMQNPLNGQSPEEEDAVEKELRSSFFKAVSI